MCLMENMPGGQLNMVRATGIPRTWSGRERVCPTPHSLCEWWYLLFPLKPGLGERRDFYGRQGTQLCIFLLEILAHLRTQWRSGSWGKESRFAYLWPFLV